MRSEKQNVPNFAPDVLYGRRPNIGNLFFFLNHIFLISIVTSKSQKDVTQSVKIKIEMYFPSQA